MSKVAQVPGNAQKNPKYKLSFSFAKMDNVNEYVIYPRSTEIGCNLLIFLCSMKRILPNHNIYTMFDVNNKIYI